MIYSGIAGLAMILLFILTVADILNSRKHLKSTTLSAIASSSEISRRISTFIILASICGILFSFNIPGVLEVPFLGLTFICGIIGSLAMLVLGLTLHNSPGILHQIAGFAFFPCLLLLPFETGWLLIQRGYYYFGILIITSVLVSLILSLKSQIIKVEKKTKLAVTGTSEVIAMLPSAVWVVWISAMMAIY